MARKLNFEHTIMTRFLINSDSLHLIETRVFLEGNDGALVVVVHGLIAVHRALDDVKQRSPVCRMA